jgi:hypothetical protein
MAAGFCAETMSAGTVEALARQLVAFDARTAEEIAEHLIARAERLDAHRDADDGSIAARAGRFRALADLIHLELAFDGGPLTAGTAVARLPVAPRRDSW